MYRKKLIEEGRHQNRPRNVVPYWHGEDDCDSQHCLPLCSLCSAKTSEPAVIHCRCGHRVCLSCKKQHGNLPELTCPACMIPADLHREHQEGLFLGKPVILLSYDDTGNVHINKAAVEECFLTPNIRNMQVYLISVFGEKRKGKSFLMNYMIRALQNQVQENTFSLGAEDEDLQGFQWEAGPQGITKGVWIWSKPFILESGGGKIAVFVLDSEGSMDIDRDRNASIKLCSAVILLSSYLIYNVKDAIEEKEVEYLKTYLDVIGINESQETQYLDILVRDWPDCEDCGNKTADSYMKKQLKTLKQKNKCSNVVTLLENPSTKCYLMPNPGKGITRKGKGRIKDMDEDFLQSLRTYLQNVMERPKVSKMTCEMLAKKLELVEQFLQDTNNIFFNPKEMSNYIKNREEMRKIQDEFLKYLQSLWSLKMPNTMWTCITTKSSELVEQFEADSLKKGRWTPILVEELKSKLDEVGKKFYSDYQWKGIKFACSALVTTYGGVVTLGGLFAAPAAAATVTSTEFLPGAILFLQGVASAVAGRILRGGL